MSEATQGCAHISRGSNEYRLQASFARGSDIFVQVVKEQHMLGRNPNALTHVLERCKLGFAKTNLV